MSLRDLLQSPPQERVGNVVVEAVALLPEDPPPAWEGDDAIHKAGADGLLTLEDTRNVLHAAGPRVVPFVRKIRARMMGKDVIAMQRALQAAGVRRNRPTGWHGPISVSNLKAFQKQRKLPSLGVYDLLTHRALARYYDSYGAWLMMQAESVEAEHQKRLAIVATALYGVSVRGSILYSQGPERMNAVAHRWKPPKRPLRTDCSGYATWVYQVARAPDPCGLLYDVDLPHYTGTMARAGRRVEQPTIGDLALYGHSPPYKHVTIFIGAGKCVSHGSNSGPLVLPVHYRNDFAMFRSYL